jgi:type II secretion system protein N
MTKFFKYIAYIILFVVSFVIFLYWVFPYDSLKVRLISGIERQLGGGIEVEAEELDTYWFSGVEISKLTFSSRDDAGNARQVLFLDKARLRASLTSLLIGSPRISYFIRAGDGEIEGRAHQTEEGFEFSANFDAFNIGAFKMLSTVLGLKLKGTIDGSVEMSINQQHLVRTAGEIDLRLDDFVLDQSEAHLGPMDVPLPKLLITKGSGSQIKGKIDKGQVALDSIALKGGDLQLDISGKIFLSNTFANSRFNVRGSFKTSPALEKALPFLFIVEKQKAADGSYPLSITGRLTSPVIKVGTFTLPL